MGRSVTGISLMTTEFGVSQVHWYLTDSPVGSKYEMVALVEYNFLRSTDVYSPTFELIIFYFRVHAFIILTLTRTYIKPPLAGITNFYYCR